MIVSRTYTTTVGEVLLTIAELAFVTILKVKRQGLGYDVLLTGTPNSRQCVYNNSNGSLLFSNTFETNETGIEGEEIYVLFKE